MGPPLGNLFRKGYNIRLDEQIYLGALAQTHSAQRIFEIGTFDGHTSHCLVQALGPSCQVLTIDLPPPVIDGLPSSRWFHGADVGKKFRGTPEEAAQITQLYGNSTMIDLSTYDGTMDLVFVDATHTYRSALWTVEPLCDLRDPVVL